MYKLSYENTIREDIGTYTKGTVSKLYPQTLTADLS